MATINATKSLSIIIPTINEAQTLPLLLADLNLLSCDFEIIVADGGSSDLTRLIAKLNGVKFIRTQKQNRGLQIHSGAIESAGEWLFFLHSDSRLNKRWHEKVKNLIKDPINKKYAWFFDYKISKKGLQWLALEMAVFIRSRFLHRPYGDQGLLMSRELYFRTGGYKPMPIMEDLDLILRIQKMTKIFSLKISIETSARKYLNKNIIKVAAKNAFLKNEWRKGLDIYDIAKKYYSKDLQ